MQKAAGLVGRRTVFLRRMVVLAGMVVALMPRAAFAASDGDLDDTFGVGGKVTTLIGPASGVRLDATIVVQPDGKYLVGGDDAPTCCNYREIVVARYNPNGSLDATFGSGGIARISGESNIANFGDLALQPDGKIVVAGRSGGPGHFFVARLKKNGSPDFFFGSSGTVTTTLGRFSGINELALLPDGKIVAGGYAFFDTDPDEWLFTLARYTADGSLDTSFGGTGVVTTGFNGVVDIIEALVLQPDGKLVAAGSTSYGLNDTDFAIARYNPNGSLDTTFGDGGKQTTSFGEVDMAKALALQADGKIVAAGSSASAPPSLFAVRTALARYTTAGSLDETFGFQGRVTTPIANSGESNALVIQPDGRLVTAGTSYSSTGSQFEILRFNANGSGDGTFGTAGRVLTDVAPGDDGAGALILQADGKLVAAGYNNTERENAYFALARYHGSATSDLAISMADGADPAVAGTTLTYTLTITNEGALAAGPVRVVDTLPAGLSFAGGSPECGETSPGVVECDLGTLGTDDQRTVSIDAAIDPALVYDAGSPVTIVNQATVEDSAGNEVDTSDNSASEETTVVAVADLASADTSVVSPPPPLLLGEEAEITLRRVVTSHGPSSPMDAELLWTATASPGALLTPDGGTESVTGLSEGELREVDTTLTVTCRSPGSHTISFAGAISPARPEDTDPNPQNDGGSASLTVHCVVPVALNNHPGGSPNPVNPTKAGVVPVAVLTTRAGEYGLPVAFDATRIQPLSVRWGSEDALWSMTATSSETHRRGHLEDSFELDEVTRDGDLDMVLHFPLVGSALQPTDDRACAIGTFAGPNGESLTFFGCDALSAVRAW